jgi:hypothetical protein
MQQLQAAAAAAVTLQDCAYCACSLALFAAAWPTAIRAIAAATASSADAAIDCGASAQPAASAASVAYTPPKLPPPPLKGPSAAASQKSLTSSSSTSISSTSTSATTALNPAAAPIQSQFSALGTSRHVPPAPSPLTSTLPHGTDTHWVLFARSPSHPPRLHPVARSPLSLSLFLRPDLSYLQMFCPSPQCHLYQTVAIINRMT